MSAQDRQKAELVLSSEEGLRRLDAKIQAARLNPYDGGDRLLGLNWKEVLANLWDWFVANWPTILKFIITIAPLLLEPKHEDS